MEYRLLQECLAALCCKTTAVMEKKTRRRHEAEEGARRLRSHDAAQKLFASLSVRREDGILSLNPDL
jgi:hypothetical protein